MGKLNMAAIFLMLLFVSAAKAQLLKNFDIRSYGGVADGNTDVSQALTSAFKDACASGVPSRVVVSKGVYALSLVKFEGPCKAPIEIQIKGVMIARTENVQPRSTWVSFNYLDNLTVSGGGKFDGLGPSVWGKTCGAGVYCKSLPLNMAFNFVNNGYIRDITSKDSKQFHVNVLSCKNVTFERFTISAPEDSINTDGIHIARSIGVEVKDSNIGTGDDCISIGDGCSNLMITRVTCGPGHGISIGSLGKNPNEAPVNGVFIKNCTISSTTNGVRIKTWPASYPGDVSNVKVEDVFMNNVSNPIIIDQVYCPWNQCNAKLPSRVKISNVSFKRIRGTSADPVAVKLSCSSGVPCQGMEIEDIDLTYTGTQAPKAVSQCSHVQPKITGFQNPPACSIPVTGLTA